MIKSILITGKIPEVGIRKLAEKGYELDFNPKDSISDQKRIISLLKKKTYDAALTQLTDPINAKVFDAVPHIKIYANYATGFDNFDIKAAKERGITLTNAPADMSSDAVAEHVVALMLALVKRIVEGDEYVRKGKYKGWKAMNLIGSSLKGKTLGLIGAGRIGKQVAEHMKGFNVSIIYYDVVRNEQFETECRARYIGSIDELLKQSDVVSLHVPLLESTKHLMNEVRFHIMKSTAFLINTSRGPVIDEGALVKALKQNIIAGAAIDVFEFEPKTAPGLTKLKNVILTPHIASASMEARNQMAEIAADNIIDFFEGKTPRNSVTL